MKPRNLIGFAAIAWLMSCGGIEVAPPEERDAYIGQVELREVRVGKTMTGRYNVYGEVHNNGDRPLVGVMLKIDWLGEKDAVIGSATRNCVSGTLDPNSMKEFKISADDAPEGWAHKVEVGVADLAFGS